MKYVSILLMFLVFFCCHNEQSLHPIERTRIMMDTVVSIVIYDNDRPPEEVEYIIDAAFNAMSDIDSLANNYNELSTVSKINEEAYKGFFEIDSNLTKIIQQSLEIAEISNGAYDISVAPVLKLWPFQDSTQYVPPDVEIKKKLQFINYKNIRLSGNKIKFSNENVKIDLGGIAKGYAVDVAMDVLLKYHIKDALINAGGDIKAVCSDLTKNRRKIWIQHPRAKKKLVGYFKMNNGSVATSGDYERYFVIDSVRYHHILNPKTGYPANDCVSVTIQTSSATTADALATAVFVNGRPKGMELINRLQGVEGVILYYEEKSLQYVVSEGLKGKFHEVELN
jgi:thiamine biosynthesis lipoprotein